MSDRTRDAVQLSITGATVPMAEVVADVVRERVRQDAKWGEQNHPDGTGHDDWAFHRDLAVQRCEEHFRQGVGTWADVLGEEFFEALAEEDPAALRGELIQVAAVAVAWCEAIDRQSVQP